MTSEKACAMLAFSETCSRPRSQGLPAILPVSVSEIASFTAI